MVYYYEINCSLFLAGSVVNASEMLKVCLIQE